MKIRMDIAYDGTAYQGWQMQAHTHQTIQEILQSALKQIFQVAVVVEGSGRTDAGVHAHEQVAHFRLPEPLKSRPSYVKKPLHLMRALQFYLPSDIVVKKTYFAPEDFHARLSVLKKTYVYHIFNAKYLDPFQRHFVHWIRQPLDLEYLQKISQIFVGEKNFKSFQNAGGLLHDTCCKIFSAHWIAKDSCVQFQIEGQRFLKQMVRNIVGTLLWMERRKMDGQHLRDILKARDRRMAYHTAPAKGLCLRKVTYPNDLQDQCRSFDILH